MTNVSVGFIVNPMAGLGGRVGLKGSDGPATQKTALERGAVPLAGERARQALVEMQERGFDGRVLAAPGAMGSAIAEDVGLRVTSVGTLRRGVTTASDTREVTLEMVQRGVDLLIFAGGDGTAVDIHRALGDRLPVIGIPAGVKMHSGVFAVNPYSAGQLVCDFVQSKLRHEMLAEVMDIDEEAYRKGVISPQLHGLLRVPATSEFLQRAKTRSGATEWDAANDLARRVVSAMMDGTTYVVGPGTTTSAIMAGMRIPHSPLGVSIIRDRELLAFDAAETDLLRLTVEAPVRIIVSPTGTQGFLLGRGNQQISEAVLRQVGPENVTALATPQKLATLRGSPLFVDTGARDIDARLCGYTRVLVRHNMDAIYKVCAPATEPTNPKVS